MSGLVTDGQAWEMLERMVGHDPEQLLYPPDIAERIERWMEESGHGPLIQALVEMMKQGYAFRLKVEDGELIIQHAPHPSEEPAE